MANVWDVFLRFLHRVRCTPAHLPPAKVRFAPGQNDIRLLETLMVEVCLGQGEGHRGGKPAQLPTPLHAWLASEPRA